MTTTARHAALMALYTFLLALGAAAPFAASYAPSITSRGDAAEVHPAGYRAPVEVEPRTPDTVTDRPEGAARPRAGLGPCGIAESSVPAPTT